MTDFLLKKFIEEQASATEQRRQYGNLSSIVGIGVNLFLAASKIIIALLSKSISLLGDGINNLFDSASAIVSLVSFQVASRPADKEHPYGHARFEYISSTVVALLIFYVGFNLIRESIANILSPRDVQLSFWSIIVLLVSILLKLWLYFFYRKIAGMIKSDLIRANAVDSLSDVLASSAVLASLVLAKWTGYNLDGYMGVIISLLIMKSALDILKHSYNSIMGEAPDKQFVQNLQDKLSSYEGIYGAHDLIVHDYGPGNKFVTVHLEVDADIDILASHALVDSIERDIEETEGIQITIHMDPVLVSDPRVQKIRHQVETMVYALYPVSSMHDFRLIEGVDGLYLLFNLTVPVNFQLSNEEIKQEIVKAILNQYPAYHCMLTIHRDFVGVLHPKN